VEKPGNVLKDLPQYFVVSPLATSHNHRFEIAPWLFQWQWSELFWCAFARV